MYFNVQFFPIPMSKFYVNKMFLHLWSFLRAVKEKMVKISIRTTLISSSANNSKQKHWLHLQSLCIKPLDVEKIEFNPFKNPHSENKQPKTSEAEKSENKVMTIT